MRTATVAQRRAVRDLTGPAVLIVVAFLLLPLTADFGRTGSVFPRLLLWTLIALNAAQIVLTVVRLRRAATQAERLEPVEPPAESVPGDVGPFSRKVYGGLFIVGSIVYVLMIPRLGYLLATFLLLLIGLRIALRGWLTSVALAALVSGSMFLILTRLLSASVPRGIFG